MKAYNRYGKPVDQFRRGTYPTYVGRVIGQFSDVDDDPLKDDWHQFILVYYPERRIIFSMTSSEQYKARSHHRDAALERVSLRFTTPWSEFDPKH